MTFKNKEDYLNWAEGTKVKTDEDYYFIEQHKYILELLEKTEQWPDLDNKSCEECKHMDTDICNMCILLEYNQGIYTDLFERKDVNGIS
jgi:hypothetical protein